MILANLCENVHLNLRGLCELGDSPSVGLVEGQEDGHLEGGGLQGVLVLEAVGHELALAHVEEPVEFPPAVLAAVESGEPAQVGNQG